MSSEQGLKIKTSSSEFYRFITLYQGFMNKTHDYGDGEQRSMVEMHILAMVRENPGITVSQVAENWGCTKGAASQNITKLEKKHLLVRTKLIDNAKEVHIFPTDAGCKLCDLHKKYDEKTEDIFSKKLQERCSMAELIMFEKVMEAYSDIVEEEMVRFKK